MAKITKKTKISKENKRLRERYQSLPTDTLDIIDGLIDRAAYMRVTIDEMEEDIDTKGRVEMFSQSEYQEPYERERPVVKQYIQMSKNYQSIIRQLDDKLPKVRAETGGDDFDDFAAGRDE